MQAVQQHPPVILLLGPSDNDKVDRWLERSPYSTHEAADPLHALEHISDFTIRNRPDVIFMHVDSVADELVFMEMIVASTESEVPIIGYCGGEKSEDTLDGLAARLFKLIPHQTAV
ncbi:MAG TPA: hypothetical protein VNA22_03645 [Pyrinomonadaceae bacterium]|nr:hypothetical protein [Pyrinomonadaceae bacterium]